MSGLRRPGPIQAEREGFTLVELLVVALLSVVVLGAVAQTIVMQSRGFQHGASSVRAQSTSRTSVQVLTGELREISATDGDLLVAGEQEVKIRSMQKIGVICDATDAASGVLDVWSIGGIFARGDSVLVFLNEDVGKASDDYWVRAEVTGSATGVAAACGDWAQHSLRGAAAGVYPKRRLTLSGPALDDAKVGGPVRSYRTATYRIEQMHGGWVLSRALGDDPADALVEHLAPSSEAGLAFQYKDTTGAALTAAQAAADPASVGQILISVRSRLAGPQVGGSSDYEDLLSSAIYLRNNEIPQFVGTLGP